MGKAARAAAAEREPDGRHFSGRRDRLGVCLRAAIPVSAAPSFENQWMLPVPAMIAPAGRRDNTSLPVW
jgi:hypothetical protein